MKSIESNLTSDGLKYENFYQSDITCFIELIKWFFEDFDKKIIELNTDYKESDVLIFDCDKIEYNIIDKDNIRDWQVKIFDLHYFNNVSRGMLFHQTRFLK